MRIIVEDESRVLDVGMDGTLFCFYSTVVSNLEYCSTKIKGALSFLQSGKCRFEDAIEVARQINLIRDELSKFDVGKIVYDFTNPKLQAPWMDEISPVVTSCGNFFTTSEGYDLIYEIVSILVYASIVKKNVSIVL